MDNFSICPKCGCTEFEHKNSSWEKDGDDEFEVEFIQICKSCGEYCGSFQYGHWEW